MSLGEVFGQVRDAIPLHHASRNWLSHGGKRELAGNDWMRWMLFLSRVQSLEVTFDPPRPPHSRHSHTRSTLMHPVATACSSCGVLFVRDRNAHKSDGSVCSVRCSGMRRRRGMQPVRGAAVMERDRKAVIVAAETIIEALAALEDFEVQHAVMAFVDAWLKQHRKQPRKPNGHTVGIGVEQ